MLRNNNKTAVKRISRRSLKNNRVRNVFSMLAIMLTTIMFTTIFTLCFSVYENMKTMCMRQQGTTASIFYKHPTNEQLEAVRKLKQVDAAGVQIFAGSVYIPEMEEEYIYFNYYDETEFKKHFMPAISDVEGHYPVKENELMLSYSSLDALGIDKPASGMKLDLDFTDGSSKEFVLSGWYKDYMNFSGSRGGLVSKKYIEENGIDMNAEGRICISPKKGQTDSLFDELDIIDEKLNVDTQNFMYSPRQNNVSATAIFGLAIILGLIIVSSGYLLIYNIMYISVSKDTRFYGMLKTIGTTPKQIKSIVRAQVMRLAIIGLPIGIIFGSGISFGVMPLAMHMFDAGSFSAMPDKIHFNPLIYAATVLFVILTIFISCRKPAKLAGSVSPVEAVKYTGVYSGKSKKKNTASGGKLYRMAMRNVFREKKVTALVFGSLFMGTMAFLAMNAFLRGLDLENFAKMYLPYDYTVNCHISNDEDGYNKMRNQSEALAEELKEIDGMSDVSINKYMYVLLDFNRDTYMPFLANEAKYSGASFDELADFYETNKNPEASYGTFAVTADAWIIEKYAAFTGQKIDIDAFVNGDICLVGCLETEEEAGQMKGKTITMISEDGGNSIDVQVASCVTYNSSSFLQFAENRRFIAGTPRYIIVSHKAMEKLGTNYTVETITMNCEADKEAYVTNDVKRLTDNRDNVINVDVKTELMADMSTSIKTMKILVNGMSLLLILIGVINFINVMMTGAYARRKEFALLESVGMTKRQVKKMLMLEGGYYGIISICLIATLGNGIIYIVSTLTEKTIDYAVAVYPLAELIIICAFIVAVCILVPFLLYKSISRESLTDRLREE